MSVRTMYVAFVCLSICRHLSVYVYEVFVNLSVCLYAVFVCLSVCCGGGYMEVPIHVQIVDQPPTYLTLCRDTGIGQ